MQMGLYAFIVVAGILNGLQTGMNSQLTKSLGNPALAGPIVYGVGLLSFLVVIAVLPFFGVKMADYGKLSQTPWWAIAGGVAGGGRAGHGAAGVERRRSRADSKLCAELLSTRRLTWSREEDRRLREPVGFARK